MCLHFAGEKSKRVLNHEYPKAGRPERKTDAFFFSPLHFFPFAYFLPTDLAAEIIGGWWRVSGGLSLRG